MVFAQPVATAGAHWAGALRVGHGCDGSATTSVRVEIPAGIVVARPQPKAGWTIVIEREPLAAPVAAEGGGMLTERVSAITWTGVLPDDQFEEFGLAAKLPAGAGPLAFPVTQVCEHRASVGDVARRQRTISCRQTRPGSATPCKRLVRRGQALASA